MTAFKKGSYENAVGKSGLDVCGMVTINYAWKNHGPWY